MNGLTDTILQMMDTTSEQEDYMGGESLGEDVTVIESGAYTIPYIGLIPISVTRDNIDEVIIGSGFHLKEDVYLNVPDQMP